MLFDRTFAFMLVGTFKGQKQSDLAARIIQQGGSVVKKVEDGASHCLMSAVDWKAQNTKAASVKKARQQAIAQGAEPCWVLPLEWFLDSVKSNRIAPETDYDLISHPEGPPPDDDDDAPAPSKKAKKKRARSPSPRQVDEDASDASGVEEPKKIVKVVQKGNAPPVDSIFPHHASTHVFADGAGVFWDAMLNQADLTKNNNKFYIIQVLKSDDSEQYWTWNRWGRVGENGQNKVFGPFGSASPAVQEFDKKFKDKTKLTWSTRNGPPSAGKYTYLERSFDEDEEEAPVAGPSAPSKKAKTEARPALVSQLAIPVQGLMSLIFNTSIMQQTMSSFEYDANKLPLGKLHKQTLDRGFTALKEIAAILNSPLPHNQQALLELSNRYYTLIPHAYGRTAPPVLNQANLLKRELDLMEALGEMKITQELMATKAIDSDMHPLDSQCRNLGLKTLEPLAPTSHEFKILAKLLANTHGATHYFDLKIVDAFKIEREEETQRFKQAGFDRKQKGERKLLWHGSRCSNFGGILSQGLKIAPPQAPVSGYMFGKGIYLASMATKSAGYCFHAISNNQGLLMLIEAQLGPKPFHRLENAQYEAAEESQKKGFLSTWGVGRTQPTGWEDASVLSPDLAGVLMPSTHKPPAEVNKTSALLYDEFIGYDVTQFKIRYLLRVDFTNQGGYY